ncbi:MAG: hypothetical protein BWY80_01229 [Firmicutes bacterium ADurb.Bin456]|nr:MAG: hypothetical protein BWY80_01229 [Firmicutes bacterium ADurb.Bin456]
MGIGAFVPHDPHAAHAWKHGKGLPDLPVKSGFANFLLHDGIGFLDKGYLLCIHGAQNPHRHARSREGLAPNNLFRQTHLLAQDPYLILKQPAQGLHQLETHILRQAAHIVVALNYRCRGRTAFHHIGVQGALHQIVNLPQLQGLIFKHPDKFLTDYPSFLFRVVYTGKFA